MFSLICACTNSRVNDRDVGDLRRRRAHHNVTVMEKSATDTRCHDANFVATGVTRVVVMMLRCRQ